MVKPMSSSRTPIPVARLAPFVTRRWAPIGNPMRPTTRNMVVCKLSPVALRYSSTSSRTGSVDFPTAGTQPHIADIEDNTGEKRAADFCIELTLWCRRRRRTPRVASSINTMCATHVPKHALYIGVYDCRQAEHQKDIGRYWEPMIFADCAMPSLPERTRLHSDNKFRRRGAKSNNRKADDQGWHAECGQQGRQRRAPENRRRPKGSPAQSIQEQFQQT